MVKFFKFDSLVCYILLQNWVTFRMVCIFELDLVSAYGLLVGAERLESNIELIWVLLLNLRACY